MIATMATTMITIVAMPARRPMTTFSRIQPATASTRIASARFANEGREPVSSMPHRVLARTPAPGGSRRGSVVAAAQVLVAPGARRPRLEPDPREAGALEDGARPRAAGAGALRDQQDLRHGARHGHIVPAVGPRAHVHPVGDPPEAPLHAVERGGCLERGPHRRA